MIRAFFMNIFGELKGQDVSSISPETIFLDG